MFLSFENSQKGVKNKAMLKANNFISPAIQGENSKAILQEHFIRILQCSDFNQREKREKEQVINRIYSEDNFLWHFLKIIYDQSKL